jgi:hypothetical protein
MENEKDWGAWSGSVALEGELVAMPGGGIGLRQEDGTFKTVGNEVRPLRGRWIRLVITTLNEPKGQGNMPKTSTNNEVLGPTNFQEFARRAIEKYKKESMIIDSMLWAGIIAHYDHAIRSRPEDNSFLDSTPGAHPAWWRGHDDGAKGVIRAISKVLDEGHDAGNFASPELEALAVRVAEFRKLVERVADLKKE